jgi:phosphoglycerate dehydrogenase-like enzyme
LWTHPRVLITPHVAGFLPGYWDAVAALFADNLRRFEQGLPLRNLVDKAAGY